MPVVVVAEHTPTAAPSAPSALETASFTEVLTEAQLNAVYDAAGVAWYLRDDLKKIARCESSLQPRAVGDGGASLGLHQLWYGWFGPNENPFDPVTNTIVAVRVRESRGRFGGAGGWSCATLLGIE